MQPFNPRHGISTLVNHTGEGADPLHAHDMPIYQTSAFTFRTPAEAAAAFRGEGESYVYTRWDNPNQRLLAHKLAALEGLDLLRAQPGSAVEDVCQALVFASGMAAVTGALLACAGAGETILAQEALFGTTYTFLQQVAPRFGMRVVLLADPTPERWEEAFRANPGAKLAYVESPSNPALKVVDLAAVAEIAHRHDAWVIADNTFATPFCQRPLTLGADVVVHSTTKYLSGHGLLMGGAVVSRHPQWIRKELTAILRNLGGSASPFDAWLVNNGLKTFALRMERHCQNAARVADWLTQHPAVAQVFYPGLPQHAGHEVAARQMHAFGGMLAFDLKGGLDAGIRLLERVQLATLVPTLGNVDTLIQHPASMTHSAVPRAERERAGITDGLVRLSVGVEDVEDILADLEQALG